MPKLRPYQRALVSDPARDALTVSATQIGKTFALASWLMARMWTSRGPHPWWWIAPTYKQADPGMRLMGALCRSAGIVRSGPLKTPPYTMQLINGAEVEFRTWDDPQNLMGPTIAGGVVDEAGILTPRAQAAISTRRSETLGPLRYIGNPGISSGPFRKLCAIAESGDQPSIYSFHKWTWHDKHAALLKEHAEKASMYRAFIEQERLSLPDYEFRRLYEADWTEDEAAVFRGLTDVITPGDTKKLSPEDDHFVLGMDVAQVIDFATLVSCGVNTRRLDLRYRARGVSYPQLALEAQRIQNELGGAPIMVEVNGPGVAIVQEFDRLGVAYSPFTTTNQSKQEIILSLAAAVQQRACTIGDHEPMPYELGIFRYERAPSGVYRYSAPTGEHDDTVMAAALANHARLYAAVGEYGWVS